MLSQEEQSRETSAQLTSSTSALQELQDLAEQTRDDLDRLTRETVKHVQTILMSYQESIQNVAALIDKKA